MGFRVQGFGVGDSVSEVRISGFMFRVYGSGWMVYGAGFNVEGIGPWLRGVWFLVQGSGLNVQGFGHRRSGMGGWHLVQLPSTNVKRFRGGLILKAHGLLYHSTLGSRVMKGRQAVVRAFQGEASHISEFR